MRECERERERDGERDKLSVSRLVSCELERRLLGETDRRRLDERLILGAGAGGGCCGGSLLMSLVESVLSSLALLSTEKFDIVVVRVCVCVSCVSPLCRCV